MKRYIIAGIMAAALLLSGCGKFVRDELIYMQTEIDKLYDEAERTNTLLQSLKTTVIQMGKGGFVREIETDVKGDTTIYTLKFCYINDDGSLADDSKPITLISGVNGKDAEPFVMSAKQDEEDGR
ncbi:MAG: hypothetical protein IKQ64_07515, partial [Bacteroidales bacterium]|nr:hypothetical protein [Bacteroidales bacterium]